MSKPKQTQKWLNQPEATLYDLPRKCPKCQDYLSPYSITLGTFPYNYADLTLKCPYCLEIYHLCIPQSDTFGNGLSIYDSNINIIKKHQIQPKHMTCPFHNLPMLLTKVFGDMVYSDGTVRVQYRCQKCHYFKHYTIIEAKP